MVRRDAIYLDRGMPVRRPGLMVQFSGNATLIEASTADFSM
jgi:hypothetical protein